MTALIHPLRIDRTPWAVGSLVIGAVLISFSGVWVKTSHVSPIVSAFYRVLFGGAVLLIAAWGRSELRWKGAAHLGLGLVCALLFALDLGFYHFSIHLVGPGLGTILPNFQVFILGAVGVVFFKDRLRLLYLLSVPMAIGGLFMIVGIDWHQLPPSYRIGVFYGLAAAACYAGFLLTLRRLQSDQFGVSTFYALMLVSLMTAAYLALEIWRTDQSFHIPDWQTLLSLAALGLFSQSIGWILITNALPHVRASLSGLLLLLQPALAFVWDVLFFQRPTDLVNWLGVAVVLLAVYLGAVKETPISKKSNQLG